MTHDYDNFFKEEIRSLCSGSIPAFKGSTSPLSPWRTLRAMYPPPCKGEIQIYRWGHFTGQLRQETGNKKGRLFAASRTSVVRAFWKARLFLAVCLQREHGGDRSEGRALAATGGLQIIPWIPTVPLDSKEGFGATVSRNPTQKHKTLHPSGNTPSPSHRCSVFLVRLCARTF